MNLSASQTAPSFGSPRLINLVLVSSEGFLRQSVSEWGGQTDSRGYEGDGKVDITVWRPQSSVFYLLLSGNNNQFAASAFRQNGDSPVAASFVP